MADVDGGPPPPSVHISPAPLASYATLDHQRVAASQRRVIACTPGAGLALVAVSALLLLAVAGDLDPRLRARPAGHLMYDTGQKDCGVDPVSACEPLEGKPYGMRRTDQKEDGNCVGIDGKLAIRDRNTHDWYAACHTQRSGKWDCGGPDYCKNGGFGVDGNDKCTCVCPWGWEGSTCAMDRNECRQRATDTGDSVCHKDAECTNSAGRYHCRCRHGFFGDGYATVQDNVKFGSILTIAGDHGWLVRPDAHGNPGGRIHGVDDGRDGWGCHTTPPKPRCINGVLDTGASFDKDFGADAFAKLAANAPPEVLRIFKQLKAKAEKQIGKCASCDPGYWLDATQFKCDAFAGRCVNGDLLAVQFRTADDQCGRCNAGFGLAAHKCVADQ